MILISFRLISQDFSTDIHFSAKLEDGYYIFNSEGEKVSEVYDYLSDMLKGRKFIAQQEGKYGLVNFKGEVIYPIIHDEFYALSNLFVGKTNNGIRIYEKKKEYNYLGISRDIDTSYFFQGIDSICVMKSDYLLYKIYKAGKVGFSNNEKVVVNPIYGKVWIQKNLLFVKSEDQIGLFKFGDYTKPLVPVEYDFVVMRNDTIYQALKDGEYEYFKSDGRKILGTENGELVFFKNGYKVLRNNKAYLYNYSDCSVLQKGIYEDVFPIGNDLYAFRDNGKIGVCDKRGKKVLNNNYEHVDLHDSLFVLRKEGKYGVLKLDGSVLIDFKYAEIVPKLDLKKPYYLVFKNNSRIGVLNEKGKKVLPCSFKQVSVRNGLILAKADDGILVYDSKGKLLNEEPYDTYTFLNYGVVALKFSGMSSKDVFCHSGKVVNGIEDLHFQGRLLKCYDDEQMYLNVFDAEGNLKAQEVHNQEESAEVKSFREHQIIGRFRSKVMNRLSSTYLQLSQISGFMEVIKRYTSTTIQSSEIREVRRSGGRLYSIKWRKNERYFEWIGSQFKVYGDLFFLSNKEIVKIENICQEVRRWKTRDFKHKMVLSSEGSLLTDSIETSAGHDFSYMGASGKGITADNSELVIGAEKGLQIYLDVVYNRINELGIMLPDDVFLDFLNTEEVLTVKSFSWTIGNVRDKFYYPNSKKIESVHLLPNSWNDIPIKYKNGTIQVFSMNGGSLDFNDLEVVDVQMFKNLRASYKVLEKSNAYNLVYRDSFMFKKHLKVPQFIGEDYLVSRGDKGYEVYKIDSSGVTLVQVYLSFKKLSDNRFLVGKKDKFGVVDTNMRTIIRPSYHKVKMVNDSLFLATRFDYTYLLNHKGKRIVRKGYKKLEVLDEVDMVIRVKDGKKKMCLQVDDNMKKLKKVRGKVLGEGYYLRDLPTGLSLLKGKEPINIKNIYRVVGKFSSGMLLIKFKDGHYQFYSSVLDSLLDEEYDSALPYEGGFSVVRKGRLRYLVNLKGDLIAEDIENKIHLKGSMVLVFSKLTNQYVLYNQNGLMVSNDDRLDIHLEVKFDYYVLNDNGNSSLFDLNGTNLGFEEYEEVHIVGPKLFSVRKNNCWFLIDEKKKTILKSGLDQVVGFNGNLYIYKYAPRYGVVNKYHEEKDIPCVYRDIQSLNGSVFRALGDEYVYYLLGSKTVLEIPIN